MNLNTIPKKLLNIYTENGIKTIMFHFNGLKAALDFISN